MSKLVKQIEELLDKNQQTRYLAAVITLDENNNTDGVMVKINCEAILYLGMADLLKENLNIVRSNLIVSGNNQSDVTLNDILDQEYENIRQGFISGDINDALINLASRLKKAKDETKLDDLDYDIRN